MKHLSLAAAVAITLVGCGGGGGSNPAPAAANSSTPPVTQTPVENKTSNSGSVDAAFVSGSKPRFLFAGIAVQASGNASPLTQASDGAVTVLGTYTLTGNPMAIQDISGNANYAQGRWNVGTATTGATTTDSMAGNSNSAYHYVVFNSLTALPTSGTMSCNAGKFTKPTYVGGGTSPGSTGYVGTASGTAGVTFDGNGAHVNLTITNTGTGASAGSTGTANLSGNLPTAASNYIAGGLGGLGNGAMVSLGDAGNGSINVIASYTVVLANNNTYRGTAVFTCK